jgi:ELWxxDGT repeat protein
MPRHLRLIPILAAACALVLAAGAAPTAAAVPRPHMIRDLHPGPDGLDTGALGVIGTLGGRLLFRADTGNGLGAELYRTDGTRAGTRLVKDINPGASGSEASFDWQTLKGVGYFTATDATYGHELWRTDGTRRGTRQVIDLAPDPNSYAYLWTTFDGKLVLQQSDGNGPGEHGSELWRSNGTTSGTKLMTDVTAGPADSLFAGVIRLGRRLLFISNDGTSGLELFRSNGTPAGTSLVKDINDEPGGILSYPGGGVQPVRFKGSIWFYAIDGVSGDPGDHGGELWRSDGSAAGTQLLKDITPGTGSTTITWLQPLGSGLVFRADAPDGGSEPWVTDGTAAGTHRLRDIWPGSTSSQAYPLGILGGRLLLSADGGPGTGRELWVTDGTSRGTHLVKDLDPGDAASDPDSGTVLGGRLYFAATTDHGRELWVTDGTARGTRRISDINPGAGDAEVQSITRVGTRLIFFADDGIHGVEPWSYVP